MSNQNKAVAVLALLFSGALLFLMALSAHPQLRTHVVAREMRWFDSETPPPDGSPERRLAPLPYGAVRFEFVAAPNNYVVAEYPSVLPVLHRLGKREVQVEFNVACGIFDRRPKWFNIRSIAGVSTEDLASRSGWAESAGESRLDPFSGACDWW